MPTITEPKDDPTSKYYINFKLDPVKPIQSILVDVYQQKAEKGFI